VCGSKRHAASSGWLKEGQAIMEQAFKASPHQELELDASRDRAENLSLRDRRVQIRDLQNGELKSVKKAFSTRRVALESAYTLISGALRPRTGDIVLARIDRLHYQRRLELENGRKALLCEGDHIIVAYGDRYATDQFESEVPLDLGPTHLVATGGIASKALSRTMGLRPASDITPIGLLGDEMGNPLNTRDFAVPPRPCPTDRPKVIAVLGTSMNSGKTTTNQALVTGLSRAGYRPGALKVTGTGSGGDYWAMIDAGAFLVADFTDAGYAATYKLPLSTLETILEDLVAHAVASDCDVILLEIADGIFQEQNVDFIFSDVLKQLVDGFFFAAGEALGATLGVMKLAETGIPVLGISGKLTMSELLIREAERMCGRPVFRKKDLADPAKVLDILSLPAAGTSTVVHFPTPSAIGSGAIQ
jgi:hypothetical protein